MIRSQRVFAQQGMALIAVLFVVLLISVLGAVAMRQGLTGLQLATNEQISKMQIDTNESVWKLIQQEASAANGLNSSGLIQTALNTEYEVVFCYKPLVRTRVFLSTDYAVKQLATVGQVATTLNTTTLGVCNASNTNNYNSLRGISLTQIAARRLTAAETNFQLTRIEAAGDPGGNIPDGTSQSQEKPSSFPIRVIITTLTPKLSAASNADINACLSSRYADNLDVEYTKKPDGTLATGYIPESITECLVRIGVPATTTVAELIPNI